jgi:hypothetical protein
MPIHPALPWTLRSIARLERAGGIRAPRLTEPSFEKWHRIRRHLGWRDFVAVLHQDLAEAFPVPFNLAAWSADPTADLTHEEAEQAIRAAVAPDDSDAHAFLRAAAKGLGLPSTGALSDVPRTQPHQKVLELPGSCGRIAAWQVLSQQGLAFHDQFVFVADSDAERILIGLAAVESRANIPTIMNTAEVRAHVGRGQRFDRAVGVRGWPAAEALAATLGGDVKWA